MGSSARAEDADRSVLDPQIQRLLAQAINSPIKLQLLLLFHEAPRLEASARQLIQRIYRDIWSTQDALRELANDGILAVAEHAGEPVYSYRPRGEHRPPIARLAERFDDPFARDRIHALLRELEADAAYWRAIARGAAEAAACACGCPPLYTSTSRVAS